MKTHLSLDDLRKTDASEELAALWEEIVADLDDWIAKGITLDLDAPVRALIASWRELRADRDSWREQAEYWEKIARLAVGGKP